MSDIVIKVSGDISNFEQAMDDSLSATASLQSGLESVAKASAAAFAVLTAEVALSVAAFAESEAAGNKLIQAMQNQGVFSDRLFNQYKKQASALQELTGVDDDAIVSATALVQAQIGEMEVTQELQQSILDLSAARDMDLQSAADLISKGINGNIVGLKKLGIEVSENANQQERLSQIMTQTNAKFGGQAQAANQGLGAIKGLRSAFGDLQEEIGSKFAPIIEKVIIGLTKFINVIKDNQTIINWTAGLLAAGVTITGLITVVSGAGIAILTMKAAVAALGLSLGVVLGPVGALGIAAGVAAGAIGLFAAKQVNAKTIMEQMEDRAKSLTAEIDELQKKAARPDVFFLQPKEIQRITDAKNELAALEEKLAALQDRQARNPESDQGKQRQAKSEDPEEVERRQQAQLKLLEQEGVFLQAKQDLNSQDAETSLNAEIAILDSKLAASTSFYEKKNLLEQKNMLQARVNAEKDAKEQKRIQDETDKIKLQQMQSTFSTISTLSSSSNQSLATIGKAAGVAQIAIATPVAVAKALAAFPPPFNFVAAGLVGAAMAAQAAQIAGVQFAEGGMMTGGIPGIDSIPATYMPGELVVPTKNFEEVISAVQTQREGGGGGSAVIEIRLLDGLMDLIETKLVERNNLGVSISGA